MNEELDAVYGPVDDPMISLDELLESEEEEEVMDEEDWEQTAYRRDCGNDPLDFN